MTTPCRMQTLPKICKRGALDARFWNKTAVKWEDLPERMEKGGLMAGLSPGISGAIKGTSIRSQGLLRLVRELRGVDEGGTRLTVKGAQARVGGRRGQDLSRNTQGRQARASSGSSSREGGGGWRAGGAIETDTIKVEGGLEEEGTAGNGQWPARHAGG